MKRFLSLLVLSLLTSELYAQNIASEGAAVQNVIDSTKTIVSTRNTYDFHIEDKDLVWQKVFNAEVSSEDLFSMLLATSGISNVEVSSGAISCNIEIQQPDYNVVGYKPNDINLNARNAPINGRVIIQIRPGRYRVTVSGIFFGVSKTVKTLNVLNGGIAGEMVNDRLSKGSAGTGWNTLNAIYTRKNKEIKESFFRGMAQTMDYYFNEAFSFERSTTNDEW